MEKIIHNEMVEPGKLIKFDDGQVAVIKQTRPLIPWLGEPDGFLLTIEFVEVGYSYVGL